MLRKILAALGIGKVPSEAPESTPAPKPPITQRRSVRRHLAEPTPSKPRPPVEASRTMRIRPYRDESCNFIYNLLFCDDLSLFSSSDAEPWLAALLSTSTDTAALRSIADDMRYDSRYRMLAFNRLRERGEPMPSRQMLGVIVEVPVERGLDTLAAFEDGSVRYINHTEKMSFFEGSGHPLDEHVKTLLADSREIVSQIGPWTEARLPPPGAGEIRITFLVSDGLYFGQGPFEEMMGDPSGNRVITASLALLQAIVDQNTAG